MEQVLFSFETLT